MRALLVHPRFPVTYWSFDYAMPFTGASATLPPLGLLTVAALLPAEWELKLVDTNVAPLRDDDLRWADVVLVGGMLVQGPSMLEIVARARRFGRRTIVGGPACTTSPSLFASADHVFCGEAEGRIESVVRAAETGRGPHVLGEVPAVRPSLARTPVPRFDLVDLTRYRSMSVQYSRGCPWSCEFCDVVQMFGRTPRVKSTAQVIAELDALHARGHRGSLFFVDDNFIGNKRAVRDLLPEIARWQCAHGRPLRFYTEASVNLASDAPLLRAMVDAGFESVFLGIETPSESSLAGANKKQNLGVDLRAAVDTITRAGIEVMGGFIVGFDGDRPDAFEAQRAFLADAPIPLAMVGVLSALPGTPLAKRLEREGRLRARPVGDQFGRPNFDPAMGEDLLLDGYARLMRDLYSTEGYYRRCAAFVDRIGATRETAPTTPRDLAIAARAIWRLGVRGDRRRAFWRLLARGARRGPHGIRWAITHAVMGEHLVRYTRDHVLPRIASALDEVRSARRAA